MKLARAVGVSRIESRIIISVPFGPPIARQDSGLLWKFHLRSFGLDEKLSVTTLKRCLANVLLQWGSCRVSKYRNKPRNRDCRDAKDLSCVIL